MNRPGQNRGHRPNERLAATHYQVPPPQRSETADLCNYVTQLSKLVRRAALEGRKRLPVVLYSRVSSNKQRYTTLGHQMPSLCRKVTLLSKEYGIRIKIAGEFEEDVSAWRLWHPKERPQLVAAGKVAKAKGAILVAMSVSRFLRNRRHAKGVAPTVEDFERFQELVGEVPLATVVHPRKQEDRGADTRRGMRATTKRIGRPPKEPIGYKARRVAVRSEVIRLLKLGRSNREIAGRVDRSESSIRRWKKRYLGA